jgi:hypothetical protein
MDEDLDDWDITRLLVIIAFLVVIGTYMHLANYL